MYVVFVGQTASWGTLSLLGLCYVPWTFRVGFPFLGLLTQRPLDREQAENPSAVILQYYPRGLMCKGSETVELDKKLVFILTE